MRRNTLLLALVMIPLFAMAVDFHPEATAELEKENFWADVSFTGDERYSITSVRAWYNHSPDKVFLLLSNLNGLVQIHDNYESSMALSHDVFEELLVKMPDSVESASRVIGNRRVPDFDGRKPGSKWQTHAFLNFNLPWPLANRWMVQNILVDETRSAEGHYRFDYEAKAGNFKTLKGHWELTPLKDKPGWTEYRAQYISNPGIPIPKFVAKKAAIISIKKDFEENKVVLSQQK